MRVKHMVSGAVIACVFSLSAQAQVSVDVSKITCDQYRQNKIASPGFVASWLSGYNAKRNNAIVDLQNLGGAASARFLTVLHFAIQGWISQIGCDANIGQAPHAEGLDSHFVIDGQLDASLQVQGRKDLQPRPMASFAFDQVEPDCGLAGFPRAAYRRLANGNAAASRPPRIMGQAW